MSAKQFFEKAIDGTLVESDFDFNKGNVSPKVIKGYVREKIKVLPELIDIFKYDLFAEEDFKKNSVTCLFGTSNGTFTLGVAEDGSPKSLMKNDQLLMHYYSFIAASKDSAKSIAFLPSITKFLVILDVAIKFTSSFY